MRYYLLFFALFIFSTINAQSGKNSLHAKFDSILPINPDAAFGIAKEEIQRGKDEKDLFLLGLGYHDMGNALWILGEYPEAVKYYLKGLQRFEELNNLWGQVITYNDISLINMEQENYEESISELRKAHVLNRILNDTTLQTVININLAENYLSIGELDSALFYLEKAQNIVHASENQNYRYGILHNLGRVYHKLEVDNLAYTSLKNAQFLAEKSNDHRYLSEILIHLGEYFVDNNNIDSANYVLRRALNIANDLGSEKRALDAVRLIQQSYENTGKVDSAFKYSKIRLNLRTVIAGAEKIRRLNNLLFLEELRQRELEEEKEQMKEARRHLLEYLFITSIIFLILIIIALHYFNKFQFRYIDTIIFIGLLFVFEFIALLVHSIAGHFTHHSPLLTFIILVTVASILVPLHHKLDQYAARLYVNKSK